MPETPRGSSPKHMNPGGNANLQRQNDPSTHKKHKRGSEESREGIAAIGWGHTKETTTKQRTSTQDEGDIDMTYKEEAT